MRDITQSNIIHFEETSDIKKLAFKDSKMYIVSENIPDFGEMARLYYLLELDVNPQPMYVSELPIMNPDKDLWSGSYITNVQVYKLIQLVKDEEVSIEITPYLDIQEVDIIIAAKGCSNEKLSKLKYLAGHVLGYHPRYTLDKLNMKSHEGGTFTSSDIVHINIQVDPIRLGVTEDITIGSMSDENFNNFYSNIKSLNLKTDTAIIYGNVWSLECQENI